MTPEQEFFTKLTALAGMVPGFALSKDQAKLYDTHLAPLGYDKINRAIDEIIASRRSRDAFPSIRDIRELIEPSLNEEAEALDISGRIVEAIAKLGPYQETEARKRIGEIGWAVVLREGGWRVVCEVLDYENMGTLKAQWRQSVLGKIKRIKQGRDGATARAEDFLSNYEREQIKHRADVLKQLEDMKNREP